MKPNIEPTLPAATACSKLDLSYRTRFKLAHFFLKRHLREQSVDARVDIGLGFGWLRERGRGDER